MRVGSLQGQVVYPQGEAADRSAARRLPREERHLLESKAAKFCSTRASESDPIRSPKRSLPTEETCDTTVRKSIAGCRWRGRRLSCASTMAIKPTSTKKTSRPPKVTGPASYFPSIEKNHPNRSPSGRTSSGRAIRGDDAPDSPPSCRAGHNAQTVHAHECGAALGRRTRAATSRR
jgi:hypothetical protein